MSSMRQGSLDILIAVSDPYWRDVSFTPLWIPDWSLGPQVTELLRPLNPIPASASYGSLANVHSSSDEITMLPKEHW